MIYLTREELVKILNYELSVSAPQLIILEYCNYIGMPEENIKKITEFITKPTQETLFLIQQVLPTALQHLKKKYNIIDIIDIETNKTIKTI